MMWSGFESKEEEYVWEVEIVQHDEDENDKDEQKNDEDDEKKKEDYEDEENVQDDVEMHGTERRVFMIRRSRWMIMWCQMMGRKLRKRRRKRWKRMMGCTFSVSLNQCTSTIIIANVKQNTQRIKEHIFIHSLRTLIGTPAHSSTYLISQSCGSRSGQKIMQLQIEFQLMLTSVPILLLLSFFFLDHTWFYFFETFHLLSPKLLHSIFFLSIEECFDCRYFKEQRTAIPFFFFFFY